MVFYYVCLMMRLSILSQRGLLGLRVVIEANYEQFVLQGIGINLVGLALNQRSCSE